MGNKPLLSVIVPVYNTRVYLERCIESLVKQTYLRLEIILVDDGSKDGSEKYCDQLVGQYPNIKVVHKKNAGLGYARNTGIEYAQGELITFLDSDDYIEPSMYETMIEALLDKNAEAVYCDFSMEKRDGTQTPCFSDIEEGLYTGKEILYSIIGAKPEKKRDFDFEMSVCKVIFRKKIIDDKKLRFLSEKQMICEDMIFNIGYLLEIEKVIYLKKCFYHYCENQGSLTHRYIENRLEKEKTLYYKIQEDMKDHLDEEGMLRLNRLFLGRVRICIVQEIFYCKDKFWKKFNSVKKIVQDVDVRTVISVYPYERNPLKLKIFHWCLKRKIYIGVYFLTVVANYRKHRI